MRSFIAITTALAVGLHLVLLQCFAWVGMAVVYSQQEGSLLDGLSMTFDGEHPCAVCEYVKAAQEQEELPNAPAPKVEIKLTQIFAEVVSWSLPQLPAAKYDRYPPLLGELRVRAISPLEKPPRLV
jgi:hypothetical protein